MTSRSIELIQEIQKLNQQIVDARKRGDQAAMQHLRAQVAEKLKQGQDSTQTSSSPTSQISPPTSSKTKTTSSKTEATASNPSPFNDLPSLHHGSTEHTSTPPSSRPHTFDVMAKIHELNQELVDARKRGEDARVQQLRAELSEWMQRGIRSTQS